MKPKPMKCDGCRLQFMSNELAIMRAKVRVGKKKIIRPTLLLCRKCREKEIINDVEEVGEAKP